MEQQQEQQQQQQQQQQLDSIHWNFLAIQPASQKKSPSSENI